MPARKEAERSSHGKKDVGGKAEEDHRNAPGEQKSKGDICGGWDIR